MPQVPASRTTKSPIKFSATPAYKSLVKNVSKELSDLDLFVKRRTAEGYWRIGKFIHEHLLKHQDRAEYGAALLEKLGEDVDRDESTLSRSLQFYRAYPIPAAPQELTWEHYKSLITIKDEDERKKIESKVIQKDWKVRDLREYLKSKRDPVGAHSHAPAIHNPPVSVARLKFTRGIVNTFQIVNVGADPRMDLGFRLTHVLPINAPKVKEGEIVEVILKDGHPSGIQKSKAAKDDLFTYEASINKIIDGDTLLVTFDFGEFSVSQKLRLRGIDCPEMSTDEGKKAKRFVETRLKDLDSIIVKTYKDRTDKYDRYLADVFYGADGMYLNQELLDEGLAVVY